MQNFTYEDWQTLSEHIRTRTLKSAGEYLADDMRDKGATVEQMREWLGTDDPDYLDAIRAAAQDWIEDPAAGPKGIIWDAFYGNATASGVPEDEGGIKIATAIATAVADRITYTLKFREAVHESAIQDMRRDIA